MDAQEIVCCLSNGNVVVVTDNLLLMYNKDDPKVEFTGMLTSFNRYHPALFDEVVELVNRYRNTIPTHNHHIDTTRINRKITLSLSIYHDGICACKASDEERSVYVGKDLSLIAYRSYRDLSALYTGYQPESNSRCTAAALAAI